MKAPSSKRQAPEKLQIPGSEANLATWNLGFGSWSFSGAWDLELGVS